MLQRSGRAIGFIGPCLPSPAKTPPAGPDWLHEIKHDGFRILVRRDGSMVRLYTRNGHEFTGRFPLIVAAVAAQPARSCLIDGEAIVSDDSGLAVFELLRSFRHDHAAVLCAFDLIELDGDDLRRRPIEQRKQMLAQLLHAPHPAGIALNQHCVGDGDIVYRQACELGCEGIVSKQLGSLYRSGRSRHLAQDQESGRAGHAARGRGRLEPPTVSLEETTDDPVTADNRNFYEVELWTHDDRIEQMLFAGTSLDKARAVFADYARHYPAALLTIRQRARVLAEWPRAKHRHEETY